ncbi:hypothetical protein D9756_004020 [Leucocoprinus leucothites]|uniref:Uncharacterized protein n=1 Tax=Leucocoprinus leucothites TaxID=201217 RepID=A0A8H5D9N7_9AGAR|nr:hypothetical protein D9756_004020 [Leucoagaricus leucothites]
MVTLTLRPLLIDVITDPVDTKGSISVECLSNLPVICIPVVAYSPLSTMIPRVFCASRSISVRATLPSLQRHFHGSPIAHEGVGEKVRELGHKVNLKVGQGLASAIDKGEKATYATKEKLESAEASAEEGKSYAEKKANDAAKGAQKAKEDLKQELKK